ncbi:MAG: DUF1553 domain-containing protein [Opitutaceae bacterium]|nr:DUF1553 domain-containing protein [Opitutaceae bacterium]
MPRICLIPALLAAVTGSAAAAAPTRLEFNRDIRPILSENCYQCHGQDPAKREAKLRLDERDIATLTRDGIAAIVPGKPDESELLRRVLSQDASEQMPPPESHKKISPEQAALLRRWIAEGAAYEKHWAFVAPVKQPVPAMALAAERERERQREGEKTKSPPLSLSPSLHLAPNPIDAFVHATLVQHSLRPSPAAPPEIWLRRAAFDLTGLPPTLPELDAFLADVKRRGEPAFAAAADRLLASPHYGERQAIEWLDAARYADTHGFNNDSARTMWRWRDWVIDAFNANLPYDRFITLQLAGDLLYPDPKSQAPDPARLDALIATGFGRNHVINSEGGIIAEEYRVEYVADRVRTMSTAWLGLTMECAKCHDHKFDPITQRDYYRLYAFFNNVPEHGEDGRVANAVPMIPAPTRAQQATLAAQEKKLAELDAEITAAGAKHQSAPGKREALGAAAPSPRLSPRAEGGASPSRESRAALGAEATVQGVPLLEPYTAPPSDTVTPVVPAAKLDFTAKAGAALAFWLRPDADNPRDVPLLSALNHRGNPDDTSFGKGRELRLIDGEIEIRLSDRYPVYATIVRSEGARIQPGAWRHVALSYAGGKRAAALRLWIDGREVALRVLHDGQQAEPPKKDFLVGADNAPDGARWRGDLRRLRGFPSAIGTELARADFFSSAAEVAPDAAAQAADLAANPFFQAREALWEEHLALRRSLPTAMVMEELPTPRPAHVLVRGNYDQPGDHVEPGVPEALIAPWPAGAPRNRLGLAQWLTQPAHPLTARVVVNRFWAQLFGTGLVKTLEDFGSQSEWPSHPELLDWLARDFIDSGWNVKVFFKRAVLSATYRQSSAVTPALLARDPENRLLARGPRVRLPAELIRDQALAISGLLAPRLGGPSVFPYQPEKLYEGIVVGAAYPSTTWTPSTGADLHRRSLYTFWKRTVPHPAMIAFDAPDREFCTVRRSRTNTPLQALVLWNEPGLLEAARHLGARLLREGGADDAARVAFAFRLATARKPRPEETRVLAAALARFRIDYSTTPADAAALLRIGATAVDASLPPADLAAAASVASMILSLDETITKN